MLDILVSKLIEPTLDRAVARGDNDFVTRLLAFMDLLAASRQEIAVVNGLRARTAHLVPVLDAKVPNERGEVPICLSSPPGNW